MESSNRSHPNAHLQYHTDYNYPPFKRVMLAAVKVGLFNNCVYLVQFNFIVDDIIIHQIIVIRLFTYSFYIQEGLYHPRLPSLRRMDMDTATHKLPEEHCRTTTSCGNRKCLSKDGDSLKPKCSTLPRVTNSSFYVLLISKNLVFFQFWYRPIQNIRSSFNSSK